MAQNSATSKNQVAFAVAGVLIGLVAGYLFFNDEGDSFIAGWLPAIILAIAAGCAGYFLTKSKPAGR